jgi:hypothetical protein
MDLTVADALGLVPVERVMSWLRELSLLDRYQASGGLARAAALVAAAATEAGLTDVEIRWYPADGQPRWWTFASPLAWTPRHASLTVTAGAGQVLDIDQARDPCAVATYSAPAGPDASQYPLADVAGRIGPEHADAIIVADAVTYRHGSFLADAVAAGAVGFVTDATARYDGDTAYRGRIELPPGTPLFAFSLTPDEMRTVAAAVERGARARAVIEVDHAALMPVVTGTLPGDEADEVWLSAHLCHPRPGANDNCSGVAGLLGAAALLAGARRSHGRGARQSIRFHWGPEYLGLAASLHQHVAGQAGGALPVVLINLDMVGEDQARCRSPFVVERPPDTLPSLLTPLAEYVVGEAFAGTASSRDSWSAVPFLGFSDHALLADPALGRPAVQFCHPGDCFNHCAADSLDKVSAVEMTRATAAAAALAHLAADGGPSRPILRGIVAAWSASERAQADRIARRHPAAWADGLRRHVADLTGAISRLADATGDAGWGVTSQPASGAGAGSPSPLRRTWPGPLNVRAMIECLPAASRREIVGLAAADKRILSLLFNFGIRVGGGLCRDDVIERTSYAMRSPLDWAVANRLLDAMVESGWVASD